MRFRIAAAVLAAALLGVAGAAAAAPRVTLTPVGGKAGARIVVRGSGWAQIEFCKPRVLLAVDDVVFARALLDGHGRFAVRWRIPVLARGTHRVFATQRCESGKDGSPVYRRASDLIRIGSGP